MNAGPSRGGAGLPENRVTARSKPPQKKCTGLHLPTKAGTRGAERPPRMATKIRQNRSTKAGFVRSVDGVLRESNRISNLDRHRPDSHRQPHLVERAHHVGVERCDGARCERQRTGRAIGRAYREPMVDEIEVDGERLLAMPAAVCVDRPRGDIWSAIPQE